MKNMKRLLSVLLCLAMVLAVMPMAFAADTIRLYCKTPDSWTNCNIYAWVDGGASNAQWPGVAMTKGSDGIWYADVDASYNKVIFNNGSEQTANLDVPTDSKVQYNYAAGSWSAYGEDVEVVEKYFVAGTSALCNGENWVPNAAVNQMTEGADGLYTITFENVPAGDHEFKVTDGTWSNSWGKDGGEDNYTLSTDSTSNITITFNSQTKAIDVDVPDAGTTEPEYDYYVAGNAALVGVEWDPAANMMTKGEDGIYTITFENIAAGTYEYKIATGSWETPSYGYGEGNYQVTTEAYLSNVTITFNAETKEANASVEVVEAEEPGVADIKWQVSADFSAESTSTDLRLVTWVDSLDYSAVVFNVTMSGVSNELVCDSVYSAINAAGQSLTAADIFGDEAAYLATYTIENIPASVFEGEIEVSITWIDLEGNETTSETRVFSII